MVANKGLISIGLAMGLWVGLSGATRACGPDALGTSRTLTLGTQDGPQIGLESYPRTLPLADHEVVLTFDDGPAATTQAVLEALAAECVEATFFLVGRNAEALPSIVKRELADGHTLGHHTYSHPSQTLRQMSIAAARADIDRGFHADDLAAYGTASDAPRVPFFRFPGFADTKELAAWLAARRIAVFGTDVWADDWLQLAPDQELAILMRKLEKSKRGIILLHDTRASTARMIPALLKTLKAGGYRVVHIVPGSGLSETVAAPQGWSSETDKIIGNVFAQQAAASRARSFARAWRPPRPPCATPRVRFSPRSPDPPSTAHQPPNCPPCDLQGAENFRRTVPTERFVRYFQAHTAALWLMLLGSRYIRRA